MRKLRLLLMVCCLVFSQEPCAQYYFYDNRYYEKSILLECGASSGIMNALTDLGGKKGQGKKFLNDVNWRNSRAAFGLYAAMLYRDRLGLRLEGSFGEITASDSILKNINTTTGGRYERNLSFRTRIADLQLQLEVHPLLFINMGNNPPLLSPYITAGAGYFSFDPQTRLNGRWYALQPLRTEGQGFPEYPDRKPYRLGQLNIAAGLGVKYEINAVCNARLELNYRFLDTDYLDDVSTTYVDPRLFHTYLPAQLAGTAQQLHNRKKELNPGDLTFAGDQRGNPGSDDSFFTLQLKGSITIGRQRR